MSILFDPNGHSYKSISDDNIKWISATKVIERYKQPFDSNRKAISASKKKGGKWYKMSVESILKAWENEKNRSLMLGTWYHNKEEKTLCDSPFIIVDNKTLTIHKPQYVDNFKIAPNQVLTEGIYPEHMVYLKSSGICGQSDKVIVKDNLITIKDYKTNKEIKHSGFVKWDGTVSKMKSPLAHLEDCNINHYALQLSIYMYIILKHNPNLKPDKLLIEHIVFEEEAKDEFGYPITKLDENQEPIIKEIITYEVPYLKSEVISILKSL